MDLRLDTSRAVTRSTSSNCYGSPGRTARGRGSPGPSVLAPMSSPRRDGDTNSAVRAYVRVRPFSDRERQAGMRSVVHMSKDKCTVFDTERWEPRSVSAFDGCFWSIPPEESAVVLPAGSHFDFASQKDVYETCGAPMVNNVFEGYNACLFAYGQTGSGKTHTVMGDLASRETEGITPRVCRDLFDRVTDHRVTASYIEIYNETVRDLLNRRDNLRLREDKVNGVWIEELSSHTVGDLQSVLRLIEAGDRQRATASTQMNEHSSRSHAIFTLTVEGGAPAASVGTPAATPTFDAAGASFASASRRPGRVQGKLHLVDLAGSERLKHSGAEGGRQVEATKINLSLTTLGRVIDCLADISSGARAAGAHIPYRDSHMTLFLKDSLGGNSKTAMIATISPAAMYIDETIQTLRYASHARKIVNVAVVNTGENWLARIKTLEAQIELMQRRQGDKSISEKSRQRIAELEERCELLEERRAETERSMAVKDSHRHERIQVQREKENRLEKQLKRSEAASEALRQQLERRQQDAEAARADTERLKQQLEDAKQKVKELSKNLKRETEAKDSLRAKLQQVQQEAEEKHTRNAQLIHQLSAQMDEVMEQGQRQDRLLEEQVHQRTQAEQMLVEEHDRAEALAAELREREAELADARERLTVPPEVEGRAAALQQQNTRLEKEKAELQERLRKEVAAVRQQLSEQLEQMRDTADRARQQHEAELGAQKAHYQSKLEELARAHDDEVAALRQRIAAGAERTQELEEQRAGAAAELREAEGRAEKEASAAEEAREQCAAARARIEKLSAALDAEGVRLADASADAQSAREEAEQQRAELARLEEEIAQLRTQLKGRDDAVLRLQSEKGSLKVQAEEAEADRLSLRQELERAKEEGQAGRQRVRELQEELAEATTLHRAAAAQLAAEQEAAAAAAEAHRVALQEAVERAEAAADENLAALQAEHARNLREAESLAESAMEQSAACVAATWHEKLAGCERAEEGARRVAAAEEHGEWNSRLRDFAHEYSQCAGRAPPQELVRVNGMPGAEATISCARCRAPHLEERRFFYFCLRREANFCAKCAQEQA
eukprot:TRINITY_DN3304_c0_g1_i1.p1 TRINITY_DN3304_c0_g1~~TRINITY_DN3304_c0_g1_i1.p1  ORF type:complete len:1075 (+),score=345.05 TRINITY_DN3304_c0_g1_i1:85-3309(+)